LHLALGIEFGSVQMCSLAAGHAVCRNVPTNDELLAGETVAVICRESPAPGGLPAGQPPGVAAHPTTHRG